MKTFPRLAAEIFISPRSRPRSRRDLATNLGAFLAAEIVGEIVVSLVCWLELKFCTVTYVLCGLSRLKEEGLSDSSAKTLSRSNRLGTVNGRKASFSSISHLF